MATRPNKVAQKAEAAEPAAPKTSIPDDAIRPQDHKSAKHDVVDAEGAPAFEYNGKKYTFTADVHSVLDDVDFVDALSDGNMIGAMKQLIGPEAWFDMKQDLRPKDGPFQVKDHVVPAFKAAMTELQAKNS